MTELKPLLEALPVGLDETPRQMNEAIARALKTAGYEIVLHDYDRPWGGFNQLKNDNADRFVEEFFPGLAPEEARLGNPDSPLSPKILVVAPEQRLSWQYHNRRAERWAYITEGGYHKSMTDEQGELQLAEAGEVVQFLRGERHRLVGAGGHYTLVAEVWQHIDSNNLSDEGDIVRLEDDYRRATA